MDPIPRCFRALATLGHALCSAALLGGPTGRLLAQAPAPLDLPGAMAMARAAGPLRQMADARQQVGQGRAREVGQWLNPTVEWRRENLGSDLLPDIFTTFYVPIDLSGRRVAQRQAATAARQRADAEAEGDRLGADLEVIRSWLRAAAAQQTLGILTAQTEALQEIARSDAARAAEGLVAEVVAVRTALEADRARVALASAVGELAQARTQLARYLGRAEHELPLLASLEAPTLPAAPDSGTAQARARQRPDVRAREAAVQEAQRRLAIEQRGVFGELQLQGGTKQTSGVMTGQVGVAMPMPLFNRNGGARQRVAGELAEARALRDDLRRALDGLVNAARRSYGAVRDASATVGTFERRGMDVAQSARVAYREGHITLTEWLDAERASADARQAQLRWATEAWLTRLELERAIGARLDAASPLDLPLLSSPSAGS